MSQLSLLNIGASALGSYRDALNTIGNNISNANTEGYTRQRVELGSNPTSALRNGSFIGSGVHTEAVVRLASTYLQHQVQQDTALATGLTTLDQQMAELDSLLADADTGLAPAMDNFFLALQGAADDPASVPLRQLVLEEAGGLANRFNLLHDRIGDLEDSTNRRLREGAAELTNLARQVAGLNEAVNETLSSTGQAPNDLLDQRDLLLQRMSELVSISTSETGGQVNVFMGNGQTLVLGGVANTLGLDSGPAPGLTLNAGAGRMPVTDELGGGELGGLLDFRRQGLDPALNGLGQLALVVTDVVNSVQAQGLDLRGEAGTDLFTDIVGSDPVGDRVVALPGNAAPDDRLLSLGIDDPTALTLSDYRLEFSGPGDRNIVLRRLQDDSVVVQRQLSGALPETLQVDGFTLSLDAGSFQRGDMFLVRPARLAARDIAVSSADPQSLALAAPVIAATALGNTGSGTLGSVEVLDASHPLPAGAAASAGGELAPPLLVRFTSATSYEVLDNSDPGNPQPLVPPLSGLPFVPGVDNALLPADPDIRVVAADGGAVGALPASSTTRATPGPLPNGYPGDSLSVTRTDPETGAVLGVDTVAVAADASATSLRDQLSALAGVTASATTTLGLRNLADSGNGDLRLFLNGINLTDPADGALPTPLTLDALAGRINSLPALADSGISARRAGAELLITAGDGRDLTVDLAGGFGDSVELVDQQGGNLSLTGPGGFGVVGASVGGAVSATLEPGTSLAGSPFGGLFSAAPAAVPAFLGIQFTLGGRPDAGDTFSLGANTGAAGDNRNGLVLAGLQTGGLFGGGTGNLNDQYGQLVERIGATAARTRLEAASGEALRERAQAALDSHSGVNLDEEAADLLRFEQAYGAATRVISVARDLFDTLLAAV